MGNLRSHLLLPPPANPHLLLLLSPPLLLPWALRSSPVPSSMRPMEWHALRRMVGGNASGWVVAATVDVSLLPKQISEAVSWRNQEFALFNSKNNRQIWYSLSSSKAVCHFS